LKKHVEETSERAAESISAALDLLQGEAEAAGLSELRDLIQQASARAKERSVARSPKESSGPTMVAAGKDRVMKGLQLVRAFLLTRLVR